MQNSHVIHIRSLPDDAYRILVQLCTDRKLAGLPSSQGAVIADALRSVANQEVKK